MSYKLKIAKVIPICKAKERNQLKNYRPISPLSSISKIFEKVVFKRLYTFINDKLYPSQCGFRQKDSTIHAVTEFHNDHQLNNYTWKICYTMPVLWAIQLYV